MINLTDFPNKETYIYLEKKYKNSLIKQTIKKAKSQSKFNLDIVRLRQLEPNYTTYKKIILLVSQILCFKKDLKECGPLILSYADGGLELMWREYQVQKILDLPRIYEETKSKWSNVIEEVLYPILKINTSSPSS